MMLPEVAEYIFRQLSFYSAWFHCNPTVDFFECFLQFHPGMPDGRPVDALPSVSIEDSKATCQLRERKRFESPEPSESCRFKGDLGAEC